MKDFTEKQKRELIESIQRKVEDFKFGILRFTKEEDEYMFSVPYMCSCEDRNVGYYGWDFKACDCSKTFGICPDCMRNGLITMCPDCGADWVGPLLPRVCADTSDPKRPYIRECLACDKNGVCDYGIEATKSKF